MERIRGKFAPLQNIGITDRIIRFFLGGALLGGGVLAMVEMHSVTLLPALAVILAVYPLMTTMMGWDPIYQMMGARTCSLEGGRNQCGTFPYEVDAALGHEPEPEEGHEYDRSLTAARHHHKKAA
ncbi:MAG TPA: DUF2892 domain-containing protein [Gammaproteobacteria bacterium]|nr:DUF2892 domain-containing protein [Gammaproteobacteria bacterium]